MITIHKMIPASTYDFSSAAANTAATIKTNIRVDFNCSNTIIQRLLRFACGRLFGPTCLSFSCANDVVSHSEEVENCFCTSVDSRVWNIILR